LSLSNAGEALPNALSIITGQKFIRLLPQEFIVQMFPDHPQRLGNSHSQMLPVLVDLG
jgi:hypothetical protein